ncbi:MAG: hypothetical protein WBO91_12980, partial [Saprospiraceae bacterium]
MDFFFILIAQFLYYFSEYVLARQVDSISFIVLDANNSECKFVIVHTEVSGWSNDFQLGIIRQNIGQ